MAEIFDRAAAMDRVDNDAELLKDLVEICVTEYSNKAKTLRVAMENGDSKTIGDVAHSMKSAFGNVGAMMGYKAAHDLEMAGRKGMSPSMGNLIDEFDSAVKKFFEVFEKEKSNLL